MKYLGGKARLAPRFVPALTEALYLRGGLFYEPFVGGFNLVPALGGAAAEPHCSDSHAALIQMFLSIQSGWSPPDTISEALYRELRAANDPTNPMTAFAAFGQSFDGKEWGGYARDGVGRRNYAREARDLLLKKRPAILRSQFHCGDYRGATPIGAVVYADPPYAGTTAYRTGEFNHAEFYEWCESLAKTNDVFVSEFTVPERDGWRVVLDVPRTLSVRRNGQPIVHDYLIKVGGGGR